MGTVTVTGRDELGRIIDVNVSTEDDVDPPGPETLAAGAAEVTIYQASVTLTDAQIKALPTTPVEIVAPTEVLEYSAPATLLPIPTLAVVELNAAASYTNVDNAAELIVAYGSDQSWNLFEMDDTVTLTSATSFFSAVTGSLRMRLPLQNDAYQGMNAGALQDNGLFLFVPNAAAGDFTGGDPANTLKVTVWYGIFEV